MRTKHAFWLILAMAIAACAVDADVDPEPTSEEVYASIESTRLYDVQGREFSYTSRTADERRVIDRALRDFAAEGGGPVPLGCQTGPGISISCWGFGKMCAAWIDEDGIGGQCWTCTVADCS